MQETDKKKTVSNGLWKIGHMPMEYIVPSLCITAFTNMAEPDIMEECLA